MSFPKCLQGVQIKNVYRVSAQGKGDRPRRWGGRQSLRKWCEKAKQLREKATGCVAVGAVKNTGPTDRDQSATGPTFLIPNIVYS